MRAAVGNGSTVHTCSPATASGSRLVASDRHARRRPQDPADEGGERLDDVLAVVEQQQDVAGAEHVDDGVVDRACWRVLTSSAVAKASSVALSSTHGHELDDVHAVGVRRLHPSGPARRPTEVLPTPPGPTSVTRRFAASASTRRVEERRPDRSAAAPRPEAAMRRPRARPGRAAAIRTGAWPSTTRTSAMNS